MTTRSDGGDHRQKKAYRSPALTAYGSIAKLTQGNTGSFKDQAITQMMAPCL